MTFGADGTVTVECPAGTDCPKLVVSILQRFIRPAINCAAGSSGEEEIPEIPSSKRSKKPYSYSKDADSDSSHPEEASG